MVFIIRFLFLFSFLFFLSANLFADDPVVISFEKIYFSPNNNGNLDSMVFSLDQKEDKELKDWNFTIFDESGKIIRKYNADLRHKRNFSIFNLFKSNDKVTSLKVRLPKQIEWNGYDSDGKIPPDGRYICRLNIHFKDNTDWQSEGKYFYLDYHPPLIKVISEVKTFRANNEKNREYLTIFQETKAENSDRWKGTIYNSENIPIRTFLWETPKVPKVFTWDGKDDRGIPMDQGKYSYEISGEDFSENMSSILINDIELKKKDPSVSVQALSDSFSPNGDNWEDSITFRLNIPETKKLKSWKMSIYEKEIKPGKEIKVFSGEESFPYYVDWDGMNEQSKKQASDSEYLYILEVDYSSEKIQTEPKKFTLDSSPIKIKFKLSSKKFTPDLDGDDDILIINPILENINIAYWKLSVVEKFGKQNSSKKKIIKKWKGFGTPAKSISWDGLTDEGRLIGSLANLELHFSFRNTKGEYKTYQVKEFSTGLLVLQVNEKTLKISVPEYIIQKDEDEFLSIIKKNLKYYPGYKVEVQSHSMQPGDNKENMKKTEKRSKEIFIKLFGEVITNERFSYRGFGEVDLMYLEEEGYYQDKNERIDFILTLPENADESN